MPTTSAIFTEVSTMEQQQQQQQQQRETSSPLQMVVLRSTPGRKTWTKRLSKTIQRRSGSFLNTLVPFRKSIDQNHSNGNDDKSLLPPSTLHHHKRHASASPAISFQTSTKGTSLLLPLLPVVGMHKDVERQEMNINNEIHKDEKKKQQRKHQQQQQQQHQQQQQQQQQRRKV
ncbi:unnamed protein product [Cercopithifilaria johnstoni]|uniref:Uncharacterized protein n=1 Tax=Cercopithifilaria johnstoni TaxID=2874296 RepID=A0A8J2MBX2_9BILA|nr:unnamed protein product [Cercopithifilaria johnstoni]